MHKEMTVAQMLPLIEETIESGGVFTLYPKGVSMLPLIRYGKDAVLLRTPERLKKGDIILYRRDNGAFVLHRIIGEKKAGFVLCGDNQYVKEPGIRREQVIAVVEAVLREGERVEPDDPEYLRYVRSLPLRRAKKAVRSFLGRVKGKILGK